LICVIIGHFADGTTCNKNQKNTFKNIWEKNSEGLIFLMINSYFLTIFVYI